MSDDRSEFLEELAQDSEILHLNESHFEVDPSRILLEASDKQKLKFNLIEWLAESPNRSIKSRRKESIKDTLDISIRQVERLLKQYEEDKLSETAGVQRSDKGTHRVSEYWQKYVTEQYEESLKKKHPLSPAEVVREVKRHAIVDLGHQQGDYPHPATIYRILDPLIEQQKRKKRVRNPGSGSWLVVETEDGRLLRAEFSNQLIQCDHTKLDILIVDKNKEDLGRPWLTTVIDTWSSCVVGYHLWLKQPGSDEVALALRHAMMPKQYPPEYELEKPWEICGPPLQYFFTDKGKDFRSKHLKAIGKKLGFQCEFRDRPPQGGIVERVFGTINTQVLKGLAGYTGSNVQERPEEAEKEACLTIDDIDVILAQFFCDDYNHQPYPKDPRYTRFERWFKGMGGKFPEKLDDRDLDICLMKETQRVVQAHGSVQFENLVYRGEELSQYRGEYITLRYDPDHILTLYVYSQETDEKLGGFLGYAHAINLDSQDLSLDELKKLNKERSKARKEHSNYDALLAVGKRKKLVEERKQEKKEKQRSEQKRLRLSSKKDTKVVELRQRRARASSQKNEPVELLPERVSREQLQPQLPAPLSQQPEPQPQKAIQPQEVSPSPSDAQEQERHRLVIADRQSKSKRIW